MRTQHARQHAEPALLRIVEALIERRAGVRDLLKRRAGLAHGIGAPGQPIERRPRALQLRLLFGGLSGLHPLHAKLGKVAQRLLERRPVLRLIRRQREAGLERRDARIGKRGHILDARAMTLLEARAAAVAVLTVETLLGVDIRRAGNGQHGRRGKQGFHHVILRR